MEFTQTRLRNIFMILSIFTFCVMTVLNVVIQNGGFSVNITPAMPEQISAEALVYDWLEQVERNLSEIRRIFLTKPKKKKIVPMKLLVHRTLSERSGSFHSTLKRIHPSITIMQLRMDKTVLESITPIVYPGIYSTCSDKRLKTSVCNTNLTKSQHGERPALKGNISTILVIPGGVSDIYGDVYVNGTRIVPFRCEPKQRAHDKRKRVFKDEVFSVAQFWADGFFHAFVESLPRLMPYVKFLRAHPKVALHVQSPKQLIKGVLEVLNLKNPLVDGTVQSRLLYLPSGGGCGTSRPGLILLSRHLMRTGLQTNRTDHILLIKREQKRWFKHHDGIAEYLKKEGAKYGLKLVVFGSSPVPTFRQSRQMFSKAALIVGPHGAGFANTIFTPAGRHVIEGMCEQKKRFNSCFVRLSRVTGLKYYGLVPKKDCFDVRPCDLKRAVTSALEDFNRTRLSGTILKSLL